MLLIVLKDLVEHVLFDLILKLFFLFPELVLRDRFGGLILMVLSGDDVILVHLSSDAARTISGHGFNVGDVLIGNLTFAKLA